jgi:hypothetical protein
LLQYRRNLSLAVILVLLPLLVVTACLCKLPERGAGGCVHKMRLQGFERAGANYYLHYSPTSIS